MLNRRTLFGAAAGLASAVATVFSKNAQAKVASADTPFDVQVRGRIGRLERLPTLNADSRNDFFTGVRNFRGDALLKASRSRFNQLVREAGMNPRDELSVAQIFEIVGDDPLINLESRVRIDAQRLAHKNFKASFENELDTYLTELEAYDNSGPGSLELDPDLKVPDYTRHEIHMQPGGYVGSPFAGAIYHYGTNAFYEARGRMNYQDESHAEMARQVPKPADGKVRRILDMGCGIAQMTVAMKEQHPQAEVWGVEVGAPMIRYGHMRAVDEGIEVHLAQRLAEDSKFPDNHFDIVTAYLLHHEIPAAASQRVIEEAYRVLRPGGIYVPIDFFTGSRRQPKNAYSVFQTWKDHRWNNEMWRIEYEQMDYFGHMEKVGFQVNRSGPNIGQVRSNAIATKPV